MNKYLVTDVFSFVHADKLSIDNIKDIFQRKIDISRESASKDDYSVVRNIDVLVVSQDASLIINELLKEGRETAIIKKNDSIVAVVGYKVFIENETE